MGPKTVTKSYPQLWDVGRKVSFGNSMGIEARLYLVASWWLTGVGNFPAFFLFLFD